jgi:type IV pilus assembly protein PilC
LVWLKGKGLTAISVDQFKDIEKRKRVIRGKKRIKSALLSEFCWQVATMIEGGVPLTEAISTVAEDMDHPLFKDALETIADKMEKGQAFSECVAEYPKIFDRLFYSMIVAGESGGAMVMTLQRMTDHFLKRDQLARTIKKALTYPAFVVGFITLIVIAMMTFIVPRFRTIFDQLGNELPAFTQVFITVYDAICNNLLIMIGLWIVLITAGILWGKTKRLRAI